jgi:hypothetical protein
MRRLLAVALFSTALFGSSCIWFFAPTSLDGFVEALIRADCHFAFACCTPPERASFFPLNFKDEGACVEESLEQGNGANSVVDRAKAVVAAGKGEFQQDRADECLKPLLDAKNKCDSQAVLAPEPQDPVCAAEAARGFVQGNVEDGDDCDDDIECADFGFCDRVTDAEEDTLTTKGKCVAAKPQGEECIDDEGNVSFCFPGTQCTPDANGNFTCEEPELLDNGEECDFDAQCESGVCEDIESGECSIDQAPCVEDTDCPTPGDFCFPNFESRCADLGDVNVEVCDGP